MKQDKALRKTLSQPKAQLPPGFHNQIMEKVYRADALRKKRNYMLGIAIASAASFLLFAGAMYTLDHYLGYNILNVFRGLNIQLQNNLPVSLYTFLSLITLILLTLDYKLRQLVKNAP